VLRGGAFVPLSWVGVNTVGGGGWGVVGGVSDSTARSRSL